jgi:hypothetical protein
MAARGGEGQRYNVIPTKVVQDLTQAYSFALPFLTVMYPEKRHLLPSPVNMFDTHSIVDLANSLLGFTEDFRKMYPSIFDVLSKVPQEAVFGSTSTFILSAAANGPDAFLQAMWEKYDELKGQTVGSLRGGGNGEDPTADLMTNLFGKRPRSRSRSVQKGGANVDECYFHISLKQTYRITGKIEAASAAGDTIYTAINTNIPNSKTVEITEIQLNNASLYKRVACPARNIVAGGAAAAAALTPAGRIEALDDILEDLPPEGTKIPKAIKDRCIAAGMPETLINNIADKKTLIAAIKRTKTQLMGVSSATVAAAMSNLNTSSGMTAAITVRGLRRSGPVAQRIIADINSQFAEKNFPPGESPFSSLFTAGDPRYSSPFMLILHVLFFVSFSCKILDTLGFVRGLASTNAPFNAFVVDGPDGPTLMMGKYLPTKAMWAGAEITYPSLNVSTYFPDTVNLLSKSVAAKKAIKDEKEKQALIGDARVNARKDAKAAYVFTWFIAGDPEKPLDPTKEIKTTKSQVPLPEGCTFIKNYTSYGYDMVEYRTPIQQKYFEMFIAVEEEIKSGDIDLIVTRQSEREKTAGSWIPIELVLPYTEMIPDNPEVALLYESLVSSQIAPGKPDEGFEMVYGPMLRVFEDAKRLIPERGGVSPTESLRRELYKVFQTTPGAFATIRGPGITPAAFVDTPYFSSGELISWYGMPYADPLAGRATSLTLTAQCFYNGYASSNIIMPMLGSLAVLAAGVAIPIPGMFRISLYAAAGLMTASTIGTYQNCASSLFVLALETFKTSLSMSILLLFQVGGLIGTRAYWNQLSLALDRRRQLLSIKDVESSVHETAKGYADGIVKKMLKEYESKRDTNPGLFAAEIGIIISETLTRDRDIFTRNEIQIINAITAEAAGDAVLTEDILNSIYRELNFTTKFGDETIQKIIEKAERKLMENHLKSVIDQVIKFLDTYKLKSAETLKQLENSGGAAADPRVSAIVKASKTAEGLTALSERTETALGVFQSKKDTPVEFITNAIEGLMSGNLEEMRSVVRLLKETPGGSSDEALKEMLSTAALSISALREGGNNTAAVAQLFLRHMYTSVATRFDSVTENIFADILRTTASTSAAAAAAAAGGAGGGGAAVAARPAAIANANARRTGSPTSAAAAAAAAPPPPAAALPLGNAERAAPATVAPAAVAPAAANRNGAAERVAAAAERAAAENVEKRRVAAEAAAAAAAANAEKRRVAAAANAEKRQAEERAAAARVAAEAAAAANAERAAAANAEKRRVAAAANAEKRQAEERAAAARVAAEAAAAANAEKQAAANAEKRQAEQQQAAAAAAPPPAAAAVNGGNGNAAPAAAPEGGYRRGKGFKGLKAFKAFKGRKTHHRSHPRPYGSRMAPKKQTRKHKNGRHTRKIRKH